MNSIVTPRNTSSDVRRETLARGSGAGTEPDAVEGRTAASIMAPGMLTHDRSEHRSMLWDGAGAERVPARRA